jgi:hypothetical protein
LHTPTSCVCGYAIPNENWSVFPNTLGRRLAGDRDEAGDIPEGDIRGDANLVAGNLEDGSRVVCGLVHDQLPGDDFRRQGGDFQLQEGEFQEDFRRLVGELQEGESQVTGLADYRHRGDRPLRAEWEVAQQSVDDFLKNHLPRRRRLPAAYWDGQG